MTLPGGTFADRYVIERELGQGGMATVYLATDLRHERQVAVKVLRSDLTASIGSERFLQEIRIAARLGHPHILPLHDSGSSNGLLYYVMRTSPANRCASALPGMESSRSPMPCGSSATSPTP